MIGGVRQYMEEFPKMKGIASLDEAVATYFKDAEPTSLFQRFLESKEVADVTVILLSLRAGGTSGRAQHVDGGIV
jgi:enoyl-[acyl-carrier-protein] reductase (NADH)